MKINARLIKETRELMPALAGTAAFIFLPLYIWGKEAAVVGWFALALGCAVMAAGSFGHEFQHRTLPLLLSQPISRSTVWREKMVVLGAALGIVVGVLWVCFQLFSWQENQQQVWWTLALIPLCALCGTPYMTLLVRDGMVGMVVSCAMPGLVVAAYAAVVDWLLNWPVEERFLVPVLLCYCAAVGWLGYVKFKNLQIVDGPSQELGLPAGLEAWLVRPLTRLSGEFPGPFASLVKKELRMQQVSFLVTGIFCVLALAGVVTGVCLRRHYPDLALELLAGACIIHVPLLPLVAGAVSLAEEKVWGIADWHLTLPPSVRAQWGAKMLVTLSTSLVLGLLLPAAVWLAGHALFESRGAGASEPFWTWMLSVLALGQMLFTSLAVHAASFANTTLRAILLGFGMVLAVVWSIQFAARAWVALLGDPFPSNGESHAAGFVAMMAWTWGAAAVLLFILLVFVQACAFSNFRQRGLSFWRFLRQAGWIVILSCFFPFVAMAVYLFLH